MSLELKLMNSDPHHLVGWARLLEWQRSSTNETALRDAQLLKKAINRAELVYKHWRPELRYKTTQPSLGQVEEVRAAANWFMEHQDAL